MTTAPEPPWRRTVDSVVLRVRLTPKGGRDAIDGLTTTADGPALKARVRAAPEDGAANTAIADLIADWLEIPRRDVTLATGHKSRTKLLALAGRADELEHRLRNALARASDHTRRRRP